MTRSENRRADALRSYSVEYGLQPQAYASVLITTGNTQVICGVSLEERVPPFLEHSGSGWITAEYGILPCATSSRYRRESDGKSGRTMEIQRLVGRSLRMMVDLKTIGTHTLRVDCDVLNADGGTRTASITGAALALREALVRMHRERRLARMPDILPVAAVSVGIVDSVVLLDLDYPEDSRAQADGNFVMAGDRWVEIQATGEAEPMDDDRFATMLGYARKGITELLTLWPDTP